MLRVVVLLQSTSIVAWYTGPSHGIDNTVSHPSNDVIPVVTYVHVRCGRI